MIEETTLEASQKPQAALAEVASLEVAVQKPQIAPKILAFFSKVFLVTYRWCAVMILYGVLASVLGYMLYVGFYIFDSAWVVPTVITPTNDKILDLTSKIVATEQSIEALTTDREHQVESVSTFQHSISDLSKMDASFQTAIKTQASYNQADISKIETLSAQKNQDNGRTDGLLAQLNDVDRQVDADLAAGMITRLDAINTKAAMNQIRSSLTDSRVTQLLLDDNAKQKTSNMAVINALAQESELQTGIAQLVIQVKTGEQQVLSDDVQIAQLKQALGTAETSPYYLATKSRVHFAFVPYDHRDAISENAPVYGCYLSMIVCHQVGTVGKIFADEEKLTHPIFRNDMRGFLIQLNLTTEKAAQSDTLFVGRKPLFF